MKTVVIGIGSLLRGDDLVGIKVAEALEREVLPPNVDVVTTTAAGLALLEMMTGYDRAFLIDAIQTNQGKPGEIYRLVLDDLPASFHHFTLHDISLRSVLEIGKRMNLSLPEEIVIFAVEVADISPLREACTAEVDGAIPKVVALLLQELKSAR